MKCRFCANTLNYEFVDLVNSPPSNSFLTAEELLRPEVFYPLKIFFCEKCFLVQIDEHKRNSEIFSDDYLYFSSYSTSWLAHAKRYVEMMIERFKFDTSSFVVEIASNDGYLLQYFKEHSIPCVGIEPSGGTAKVARDKGVETLEFFFSQATAARFAKERKKAELILGNNVLAHVPDINDFIGGIPLLLAERGVVTMEFPHLMQMVEQTQFDTIYHEHYSYLSFLTVTSIFARHGLVIFDVEELPTHGGSLRVFACHEKDKSKPVSAAVGRLLSRERSFGMNQITYYEGFQEKVVRIKLDLLKFLIEARASGKTAIGYGAAAKGNTLINYCGIKKDLLRYVVDASPHKQGRFLPGSHIPVVHEDNIRRTKPDYVIILPWNIRDEIMEQLGYIREWGGKFVVAIPHLSQL
jgi:hypothetical protein